MHKNLKLLFLLLLSLQAVHVMPMARVRTVGRIVQTCMCHKKLCGLFVAVTGASAYVVHKVFHLCHQQAQRPRVGANQQSFLQRLVAPIVRWFRPAEQPQANGVRPVIVAQPQQPGGIPEGVVPEVPVQPRQPEVIQDVVEVAGMARRNKVLVAGYRGAGKASLIRALYERAHEMELEQVLDCQPFELAPEVEGALGDQGYQLLKVGHPVALPTAPLEDTSKNVQGIVDCLPEVRAILYLIEPGRLKEEEMRVFRAFHDLANMLGIPVCILVTKCERLANDWLQDNMDILKKGGMAVGEYFTISCCRQPRYMTESDWLKENNLDVLNDWIVRQGQELPPIVKLDGKVNADLKKLLMDLDGYIKRFTGRAGRIRMRQLF